MSKKPPKRSPEGTPPPGRLPDKKPPGTSPLLNPLSETVPYSHVKPVRLPILTPKKAKQSPLKPLKPKKKVIVYELFLKTEKQNSSTHMIVFQTY